MKTIIGNLFIIYMALTLSGCVITSEPVKSEFGHYYINPNMDFSMIGKVVIFEVKNNSSNPIISDQMTEAIRENLQKKHLFSVSTLYRKDPKWMNLNLENSTNYTLDELSEMRKELKADSVIFGTITQYYSYPHMLMGLHLKMINLRTGKLDWALEQVWDSTDKKTERRMKLFFDENMRQGYQPMDWRLLITSPKAFNKFVCSEIADTFPDL